MTTNDLKFAFAASQQTLTMTLQDVTPELALTPVPNSGTTIHWLLGSILSLRFDAVKMHGGRIPAIAPNLSRYFVRRAPDANPALSYDELTSAIPVTFDMLNRLIDSFSVDDLYIPYPVPIFDQPADQAQTLMLHSQNEMYYIGQISLARRVLGLAGVGF